MACPVCMMCGRCGKEVPVKRNLPPGTCPHCGHANLEGVRTCGKCGKLLPLPPGEPGKHAAPGVKAN